MSISGVGIRFERSFSAGAGRGAASSRPEASFRALAGGSTPLDGGAASQHLAAAYREVTGSEPTPSALGLLWAQWALETARGQAMYGYNFAGIKAGPRANGVSLRTKEGYGAHERHTVDRFRTYPTPQAGARDYVRLLRERFPSAFEALASGDASAFARELGRGRYFTARVEAYRAGIERLAAEHLTGELGGVARNPALEALLEGVRQAFERALAQREGE